MAAWCLSRLVRTRCQLGPHGTIVCRYGSGNVNQLVDYIIGYSLWIYVALIAPFLIPSLMRRLRASNADWVERATRSMGAPGRKPPETGISSTNHAA